jgi:signal transduction histidine kinase
MKSKTKPTAKLPPEVQTAPADIEIESLLFTIAHDLRAPLRSVQGFATMLLEEKLTDHGRDFATRIINAANHMDGLLMDLAVFRQVSQQAIELREIPLKRVLDFTLVQMQKEIEEAHASIESVGPWPSVLGHEKILQHVLAKLIRNALKLARPGEAPHMGISASESGGRKVRVYIEDNGIDIDPENLKAIWKMGTGLPIVAKGIKRLGGKVGGESTVGKGSRFWFELAKA